MPQSCSHIAGMRRLIAILGLAGLGCGMAISLAAADVPLPKPRPPQPPAWAEPRSFLEAAGPDFNSAEVTAEPSECRLRLEKFAAVAAMPRLVGPDACGGADMVRLDAVLLADGARVDVNPAPFLRCEFAESFAAWVRDEAAPRMAKAGPALKSVATYDDFSCRGRNRVFGAMLSEHGKGNAVDVRAFTLADRRVIGLTDMTAPKDLREELRDSACHRFATVLGPGADSHHEAHIHLDTIARRQGYRICQWAVREPPKPEIAAVAVPLPLPRPSMAGAAIGRKL
jgi:hypothetical protein